jgi:hypothetical protein
MVEQFNAVMAGLKGKHAIFTPPAWPAPTTGSDGNKGGTDGHGPGVSDLDINDASIPAEQAAWIVQFCREVLEALVDQD